MFACAFTDSFWSKFHTIYAIFVFVSGFGDVVSSLSIMFTLNLFFVL